MKKLLATLMLGLALPLSVNAQDDTSLLGDDFTFDYYGQVNANGVVYPDYGYNYTYSWLSLGVEWRHKVRAVLTTNLTTLIENGDVRLENGFDIEEFITNAYIEVREVGGLPVAIIVGKRSIPFANAVEAMPVFGNNPLSEQFDIDEVFGFSVRLNEGFLGIFDGAEISAFETEEGDLSIGSINGVSVKLDTQLTDSISLGLGQVLIDRDGETESKTTIGLIGKSASGDLVGWINGMVFSNNPEYPGSDFAITAGAKFQFTGSTDVVVEMNYVEKEVMQYAVGANVDLTRRLTVGAEVRYNDYQDDSDDEVVFGLNARYSFGVNDYAPNDEYIFGSEND